VGRGVNTDFSENYFLYGCDVTGS